MGELSEDFSRHEFACSCGCGCDTVDSKLIDVLQDVRDQYDSTVTINSGHRCWKHNTAVGGGEQSQHLFARAADIEVHGVDPHTVYDYLDGMYPDKYGIGKYDDFTHIDTRKEKARW